LSGYPSTDDIVKEMMQNADDAGATRIHFICDARRHPTEMIFGDTWKHL